MLSYNFQLGLGPVNTLTAKRCSETGRFRQFFKMFEILCKFKKCNEILRIFLVFSNWLLKILYIMARKLVTGNQFGNK